MIKRSFIREETEIKKIFKSVTIEKPSADFTLNVMDKISREKIVFPVIKSPMVRLFYLLLIFPVSALLFFGPAVKEWISGIDFSMPVINWVKMKDWSLDIFQNLKIIASPALVSIILATFMLVAIFAWVNSRNFIKD